MSIEIFHKSIFIAKKITVLYFCTNKLNSKKDETTSSIFRNDLGRGHFGFRAEKAKSGRWTTVLDYALEKNIQLQQDKISLEKVGGSVTWKTAKAALFPSLSFSTGAECDEPCVSGNRNTVSGTEIISSDSKTTYNGNYGLNAQWTLWNGNKRLNAIKQKKTSQQIAGLTVAETENSLQEQIAQIFRPDTLCRRVGEN